MNRPSRRWQAFLGYAVDVCRFARARFENPHSYLKFLRLAKLQRQTGAEAFIETGTFLGVTAYRCSKLFQQVLTIEIDPALAAQARDFLRRRPNVRVLEGDAVKILPSLFDAGVSQSIVFLDGHYSGVGTGRGDVAEPAIEELRVLSRYTDSIEAIVVDDFRSFGVESGFPSKSQLLKTAEGCFSGFSLQVEYDQVALIRKT